MYGSVDMHTDGSDRDALTLLTGRVAAAQASEKASEAGCGR
jgi:hypothetical protein